MVYSFTNIKPNDQQIYDLMDYGTWWHLFSIAIMSV